MVPLGWGTTGGGWGRPGRQGQGERCEKESGAECAVEEGGQTVVGPGLVCFFPFSFNLVCHVVIYLSFTVVCYLSVSFLSFVFLFFITSPLVVAFSAASLSLVVFFFSFSSATCSLFAQIAALR